MKTTQNKISLKQAYPSDEAECLSLINNHVEEVVDCLGVDWALFGGRLLDEFLSMSEDECGLWLLESIAAMYSDPLEREGGVPDWVKECFSNIVDAIPEDIDISGGELEDWMRDAGFHNPSGMTGRNSDREMPRGELGSWDHLAEFYGVDEGFLLYLVLCQLIVKNDGDLGGLMEA